MSWMPNSATPAAAAATLLLLMLARPPTMTMAVIPDSGAFVVTPVRANCCDGRASPFAVGEIVAPVSPVHDVALPHRPRHHPPFVQSSQFRGVAATARSKSLAWMSTTRTRPDVRLFMSPPPDDLQGRLGDASLLSADPNPLLDRGGALDRAAGYVQGLYWAQFADDTYTGGRTRRNDSRSVTGREKESSISRRETLIAAKVEGEGNSGDAAGSSKSIEDGTAPRKPYAPVSALLPATAVRLRIDYLADDVATYCATFGCGSSSSTAEHVEGVEAARERLLERTSEILSTSELSPTSNVRAAFNSYTAALRFGEDYTLNLPRGSAERRRMIREDRLPNVKAVITADLDLRDLSRNEVLTGVDDVRAEISYQRGLCSPPSTGGSRGGDDACDLSELASLVLAIRAACEAWFDFIPDEDVEEAVRRLAMTERAA